MNLNNLNVQRMLNEGIVLTVYQNGQGILRNGDRTTSKGTQSIHRFSSKTVKGWLETPSSQYGVSAFKALNPMAKINGHVEDFVHDMRLKFHVVSWKID